MPVGEQVLGFTNRWYAEASSTAKSMRLADDVEMRVVAVIFCPAMTLRMYSLWWMASAELVAELLGASNELRAVVLDVFVRLLAHPDSIDCLPGLITDADRADVVPGRLWRLVRSGCER